MLYQKEFSRIKEIYKRMPPAKREMAGPILALPLAAMGVFGLLLMPFGLASLATVIFVGALGALITASMMVTIIDFRPEFEEWRRGGRAEPADDLPGEAAIRMLSVANDPGTAKTAENAGTSRAAQG
jgi:NADH:ubiquinone oxidoreductase subunit 6 (subunit J)